MKRLLIIAFMIMLCSCFNINENEPPLNKQKTKNEEAVVQTASFPCPLLFWEQRVYCISNEEIDQEQLGENIGEVLYSSNNERDEGGSKSGFSTTFAVGSKIWTMKGMEPEKELTVEREKGYFIKVVTMSSDTD